ncbi:MAG: DUF4388 domain-containing protein [Planctomycetota bacterium]|nr:DUF4388 domain-containing protein [Planctomycetota bacterium]
MGLKGSVRALSLDQLLDFLSQSGHAGVLKISFKDRLCVLCLKDAVIYIDQRGKGEIRLGEILVQRGIVAQDKIDEALIVQDMSGKRIGDVLIELGHAEEKDLNAAFRAQLEEEIYDLFVLDDAFFDFERGLPENFSTADLPAFPIRSILMEAARRFDQWSHIKKTIHSRKCFYRLDQENPKAAKQVAKALNQAEDEASLFENERSLEETLPLLGMTQFQGLSLLAFLISEGHLAQFTPRQLEVSFREKLIEDLPRALKYYECALELDEFEARQRHLDRMLFQTPSFRDNPDGWKYSANVKGRRALLMLLSLFRQNIECEFFAREDEKEFQMVFHQGKLFWRGGDKEASDTALKILKKEGQLTAEVVDEVRYQHLESGQGYEVLFFANGKLSQSDWQRALATATLNKMFDLVFWKLPFVQVQTGKRFNHAPNVKDLTLHLEATLKEEITGRVKEWERVTQVVPSVRAFFKLTQKGEKSITTAVDDLKLFDGRRSLEQIMKLLRKEPLVFFSYLYEQQQGGRVVAFDEADYRKHLDEALGQSLVREAIAYCTGAIDSGLQVQYFKERRDKVLERHGEGSEERTPAKLTGDLASFSLAEVLQSFHMSKRSGTLRIFLDSNDDHKGGREKEIYFENGNVFLLEVEDYGEDFLLDVGFVSNLQGSFQSEVIKQGLITEDQLEGQLAEQIKEDVYDVFLWDGACFEFTRDELPPEFFEVSNRVKKYSLNTGMFLLEAVRRITEWENIREVVPSDDLVVAFESYDSKMRSVTERGSQEVQLLIDGRHTVQDILRISGARRFHAVALIAELLGKGILHKVDVSAVRVKETTERSGEVPESEEGFLEVLRSLQEDQCTGVLRVTDGRRSKECVFIKGVPHRADAFKKGTGNADVDAELSTRFYARDFAEIVILNGARYQLLENVLPPALEKGDRNAEFILQAEEFFQGFLQAAKRWKQTVSLVDRDKPLAWRDEFDAQREAQAVPAPANVLDWIDGKRSAEDIIRTHPDGRYLSYMSLAELITAGVVIYAEPAEEEEEDWDFSL